MKVSLETKEKILAEILTDTKDLYFLSWDGTFADLHNFVDANEYLESVFGSYPTVEEGVDACNEVVDYLEERLASVKEQGKRGS